MTAKMLEFKVLASKSWDTDARVQNNIRNMAMCNIKQDNADAAFEFSLLEVVKSLLESNPARTWEILDEELTEMKRSYVAIRFGEMFFASEKSMTEFLRSAQLTKVVPNAAFKIGGIFSRIGKYFNECQRDPELRKLVNNLDFGNEFHVCVQRNVSCDTMAAVYMDQNNKKIVRAADLRLIECSTTESSMLSIVSNTASTIMSRLVRSTPSSPNFSNICSVINGIVVPDELDYGYQVFYQILKSPFDSESISELVENNLQRDYKAGVKR